MSTATASSWSSKRPPGASRSLADSTDGSSGSTGSGHAMARSGSSGSGTSGGGPKNSVLSLRAVSASRRPIVVLTSNATRELSEALKRRCLYLWLEHPDLAREIEILRYNGRISGEAIRRAIEIRDGSRRYSARAAATVRPASLPAFIAVTMPVASSSNSSSA